MRRYLFITFVLFFGIVLSPSQVHADALLTTVTIGSNPIESIATGTMVYTSNVIDNTVSAIDTSNNNAVTSIGVGGSPGALFALGSKIYSIVGGPNRIVVIDPTNNYATSSLLLGSSMGCFGALGTTLYVCNNSGNTVTSYNTQGGATSSITVGNFPSSIAAIGTKVYVANFIDNTVTSIDTANGNATSTITLGSAGPSSIFAFGTKLYTANQGSSTVTIIDTANGNATSTVATGSAPRSLVYLSGKVYVADYTSGQVTVIDTQNGNAVSTVAVGQSPEFLTTYGTKVYASNAQGDSVYSIDSANGNAVAAIPVGEPTQGIVTVGSKVYADGEPNTDYVIDVNTVPAVLTQLIPVASTVSGSSLTYSYLASFPTSEQEALHVGAPCTSGPQVLASQVSNGATSSIQISNYSRGTTYECPVDLIDGADNTSNILNIGPFAWPAAPVAANAGGGQQYSLSQMIAMGLISPATAAKYGIIISGQTTSTTSISSAPNNQFTATASPTISFVSPAHPIAPISIFNSNLSLGMTGIGVLALQQYLNTKGFTVATTGPGSSGQETQYFGHATKAALIKFQTAVGITPASGYFGPITRAYIANH